MARLFISHSSRDNFEAKAFHDWLVSQGWAADDIFLDLHDIGAGTRWKEALAKANERCEAVVLLASPAALASTECRLEIRMAEDYGKEIIVAILDLLTPDDATLGPYKERQIVDLGQNPRDTVFTVEHKGQQKAVYFNQRTLRTIKTRLDQLGISPNAFTWRPADLEKASPYPGFESFREGEAALFFGRAGDIARGLAEVRKMRRLGTGQIMLIQAASGAGKSSFLRAGLWPRLGRDPEFLPLAMVRPATGIITGENGLGRQLAAFFAAHRLSRPAGGIHQSLRGDLDAAADALIELVNEATAIGQAMIARPDAAPPTPLVAVDQAEELFATADQDESRRFLDVLARVLDPNRLTNRPGAARFTAPPLLIWTIRADSLDALLHAADAVGLKAPEPFLLPPIPRENYREIIEQPITIANQTGMKVAIDPLLTIALVTASTGADALPLLAFSLRQLMEESRTGAQANLTLDDYTAAGGIDGVLRKRLAAAQREARASDADLRRLIIPNLATWDEEANPPAAKRLVIDEAQLLVGQRADLQPLADALVEARLLTRAGGDGGRPTLEVAHEALLRLAPISTWLHEDRDFLVWLANIARARQLEAINTGDLFFGGPMEDAKRWLAERNEDIPAQDRTFIEGALTAEQRRREAERARQEKELAAALERETLALNVADAASVVAAAQKRLARRTMVGLVISIALALIATTAGLLFFWQQQRAEQLATDANTERANAEEMASDALEAVDEAQKQTGLAEARKAETEKLRAETQVTESGLLANAASALTDHELGRDVGTALLLALEGLPDKSSSDTQRRNRPYVPEAEFQLDRAGRNMRERLVFTGHGASVSSAVWSPDGRRIVTTSEDNTARIWEATSGKELALLTGHVGKIHRATWSSDGTRILTSSDDKTVRVWNAENGKELLHVDGYIVTSSGAIWSSDSSKIVFIADENTATVLDAAGRLIKRFIAGSEILDLSPDGLQITTREMKNALVQEVATGRTVATLSHDDYLNGGKWSSDGTRLVTFSSDDTVRLWDAETWKEIARITQANLSFPRAAFSRDGGRVVLASAHGTASIWDLTTSKQLIRFEGHNGPVLSAAWSADGTRILTASADGTARIWDASTGKELARLDGHDNIVGVADWNSDDSLVLTKSSDGLVRIWNATSETDLKILRGHCVSDVRRTMNTCATHVAFSPDGRKLATVSEDHTARTWDAATGAAIATLSGHRGWVTDADWDGEGTRLLTTSQDGTARIWDATSAAELIKFEGHNDAVRRGSWSPDGREVVTTAGNVALVWSAASGQVLVTLSGHVEGLTNASWSRDGTRILTSSYDGTAKIWNAQTGEVLATLMGHSGAVRSASWNHNGTQIVTASDDKTAIVWDSATGQVIANLTGHLDVVFGATWSNDGRLIATASEDSTARIWDAATGKQVRLLTGHRGGVGQPSWSADGTKVLTVPSSNGGDGNVRVWDVPTGRLVAALPGAEESGAWSPLTPSVDGSTVIATGSLTGSAHIWRVFTTTQALVDAAKARAARCLTQKQRTKYFLPPAPPTWCVERRLWPYYSDDWQGWLPMQRAWLASRRIGDAPLLPKAE